MFAFFRVSVRFVLIKHYYFSAMGLSQSKPKNANELSSLIYDLGLFLIISSNVFLEFLFFKFDLNVVKSPLKFLQKIFLKIELNFVIREFKAQKTFSAIEKVIY